MEALAFFSDACSHSEVTLNDMQKFQRQCISNASQKYPTRPTRNVKDTSELLNNPSSPLRTNSCRKHLKNTYITCKQWYVCQKEHLSFQAAKQLRTSNYHFLPWEVWNTPWESSMLLGATCSCPSKFSASWIKRSKFSQKWVVPPKIHFPVLPSRSPGLAAVCIAEISTMSAYLNHAVRASLSKF